MAENEVKVRDERERPWYEGILRAVTPDPIERMLVNTATGQRPPEIPTPSPEARGFQRDAPGIYTTLTSPLRYLLNQIGQTFGYLSGEGYDPSRDLGSQLLGAPGPTQRQRAYGRTGDPTTNPRVQQFYANREGRLAQAAEAERQAAEAERLANQPTYEEFIGEYQFDGTPYDEAANYMQERREAQMRAIQDMYNEYAAETQANVDRIGDIYGGAEAGIGETYAGATGNIEDAYASAQQQAADQMARLGIEEAAPAVLDPMALSQAETLSNLETGRASSLGATQQFGATAGGFATDMATVAQQQALENQRSLTDQLADQLFEIEMQRMQAQQAYNPYQRAMQEIEARQAFENFYNPQVDPLEQQQMMMDVAGVAQENRNQLLSNYYAALQAGIESGLYENTPEGREQAWQDTMAAWQRAESVFPIG